MPHISLEYSANLEPHIDIGALCEHIRQSCATIDTFPLAGIRVRALRADAYAVADGDKKHGFIDISIRLRGGRPMDVKQAATQAVFAAAENFIAPVMATRSIALSLEMRDIDPELSPKTGTIREHLQAEHP